MKLNEYTETTKVLNYFKEFGDNLTEKEIAFVQARILNKDLQESFDYNFEGE